MALARPELAAVSTQRKAALLEAVAALNPGVKRCALRTDGKKVHGVRQKTTETVSHEVSPGIPLLVPTIKDLEPQATSCGIRGATGKAVRNRNSDASCLRKWQTPCDRMSSSRRRLLSADAGGNRSGSQQAGL